MKVSVKVIDVKNGEDMGEEHPWSCQYGLDFKKAGFTHLGAIPDSRATH